jgi:asparagine synthase (glutamine-hydrolysing)
MCGIAGLIDFKNEVTETMLIDLCDRLVLRGPDAAGYFLDGGVALGHRRLSILDLETGDQPMHSTDGRVVLVFNGEIYNYQELKEELIVLGYIFGSTSDTEVIIVAYLHYGIDTMLDKIEGMFAFALYDRQTEQVFIARDRFGEKPLYIFNDSSKIIFASELKALMQYIDQADIDMIAVNLFMSLSYIPAPYTIYTNVKKLLPATYLSISTQGTIHTHKYYDLLDAIKDKPVLTSFDDVQKQLFDLLNDAVAKRMVADVPFGSFLSGGIDSSIVTAIMAKISNRPIETYSIGFVEKEYDESERAQLVAKHCGTDHTVHFLDYKDVVHDIDEIINHFDEPFGDSSAIPSFYVAQLARKSVKMVLTGDAADEIFGGYEKYLASYYSDKFKRMPRFLQGIFKKFVFAIPHTSVTNSILRRIKKVINFSELSAFDLHYNYMCLGFNDLERKSLMKNSFFKDIKLIVQNYYNRRENNNELDKGLYTDLNIVLEGDMLVKVDRMCMKSSLEARVPFLDRRIVELAYRMPTHFKIKGRDKKHILKKTFSHLLPPATIRYRKKGFGVPVDYWLNNQLKEDLMAMLSEDRINRQGIFEYKQIKKLLDEHQSGKQNHKGMLWNLYVFQKFMNRIN